MLPAICERHGDGKNMKHVSPSGYYGLYTGKVNGKVAHVPCF